MKKYFRKVLEVLKTRKEIKALGLSRKELKGIAAKVADKLDPIVAITYAAFL